MSRRNLYCYDNAWLSVLPKRRNAYPNRSVWTCYCKTLYMLTPYTLKQEKRMPVYFTDRCPHCQKVINTMRRYGDVIGNPFVSCPYCKNKIFTHFVKEWDEYPLTNKLFVLVVFTIYSLFWSVIALIVTGLFFTKVGLNHALVNLILVVPVCFIVYRYARLTIRIVKSKKRTSDPAYLALVMEKRK